MGNRERLNSFLRENRQPFTAAWRWATGHWKRWKALRNWAKDHGVNKRKDQARWAAAKKKDQAAVAALRKQAGEIHEDLAHIRSEIEKENKRSGGPRPGRLTNLEGRKDEKLAALEKLRKRIQNNLQEIEVAEKRIHDARELAKGWFKRHTVYRRRWKRARKRHHRNEGPAKFESWMLNGHSGNIDDDLKACIAFLVVERSQVVTDTYDYSGHSTTSHHYPRNNSDGKGHAVDWAGSDMGGAMTALIAKFGQSKFWEQFGPAGYYIKYGQRYGGTFPGHYDHGHTAVG